LNFSSVHTSPSAPYSNSTSSYSSYVSSTTGKASATYTSSYSSYSSEYDPSTKGDAKTTSTYSTSSYYYEDPTTTAKAKTTYSTSSYYSESDPDDDKYTTTTSTKAKPTFTTSTYYSTETYTITHCATTVTNCPAYSTETTQTVKAYTTICPVDKDDDYPEETYAPESTETVYATHVHTVTVHGQKTVSTESYPIYTTTYSVPAAPVSSKPASSVDVKAVVPQSSSMSYAPVYPSSVVSVGAKPVSSSVYYPIPASGTGYDEDYTTTYKPAAGTGYSATYTTPYAAQFTGAAASIGVNAFAIMAAAFLVLLV
jgi:hypothetical protein